MRHRRRGHMSDSVGDKSNAVSGSQTMVLECRIARSRTECRIRKAVEEAKGWQHPPQFPLTMMAQYGLCAPYRIRF